MKNLFERLLERADLQIYMQKLYSQSKNDRKKDREEFLSLLFDDEVIKNNRKLQEKYMELYDKYTRR